jgi:DNA-binding CsgD family transcriptional regulator/sugar-specific transcriptional regulator TrmB
MLQGLGLSALQEQVYRALLDEPTRDTAALAGLLGFPEAAIEAAIAQLTELTLLRKSRQDPSRRYPVALERCVTVLLRRQEAELEARRKALLEGRAAAAALTRSAARRRFQDPTDIVRVTAIDDIQNTLESLLHSAAIEVCSMIPNVMPREALEASRYIDEEVLRNRIKTRMLCGDHIRSNAPALAYEHEMLALGAQIRVAPALPIRLLIVDRTYALLPFDSGSASEGAIVTTAPGMVTALCELFDRCWDAATPLEDTQPHDEATRLSATEAELLRLLSGGLTDEAAAKRLGVSVRTVKRRMEDLMRRLDAGSRFEAGFRAARRGWL